MECALFRRIGGTQPFLPDPLQKGLLTGASDDLTVLVVTMVETVKVPALIAMSVGGAVFVES